MFRVAIIGRPNVGKSTLFNKLVGKHYALTDDLPGVTRDRKEAFGNLGPLNFVVIDTAGLENKITDDSLNKRMVEQTELAIGDADCCLFVVDGKSGIENDDLHFANWLRKSGKPTILIANKCENYDGDAFTKEFYKLGFGKPIAISAEHKIGFMDLYEELNKLIEKYQETFAQIDEENNSGEKNYDLQKSTGLVI
jgi:GTP-binding protein